MSDKKNTLVYRIQNPAQVERLIRELWYKHKECEQSWMGEEHFGDAVCELLDKFNRGEIV